MKPPVAAKKAKATTRFGDRRVDNYQWLRDKDDPAVVEYLNAERSEERRVGKECRL